MIPESLCLDCKMEVAAGYKDTRVVAEARRTKRRELDGDWQRELLLGSSADHGEYHRTDRQSTWHMTHMTYVSPGSRI